MERSFQVEVLKRASRFEKVWKPLRFFDEFFSEVRGRPIRRSCVNNRGQAERERSSIEKENPDEIVIIFKK